LEKILKKDFNEFKGDLQRITGLKYNKSLTFGRTERGGWKGFRLKEEEEEETE
jgi:hypothetical protein